MKRITIILAAIIALAVMSGCRRSESNGDIDGFWRVESIEYRADGKVTEIGNRYFGIQLELFQLRSTDPIVTGVLNYDTEDDKLTVDFRDPNPVPDGLLETYGIMENPVTFNVSFPNHDHMVLITPQTIIKCRRW